MLAMVLVFCLAVVFALMGWVIRTVFKSDDKACSSIRSNCICGGEFKPFDAVKNGEITTMLCCQNCGCAK